MPPWLIQYLISLAVLILIKLGALIDHIALLPAHSGLRRTPSQSVTPGSVLTILPGSHVRIAMDLAQPSIFQSPLFTALIGAAVGVVGVAIGAVLGARLARREARTQRTFENRAGLAEQDRIAFDRRVAAAEKDAHHLTRTVAALRTVQEYLSQGSGISSAAGIDFDGEGLKEATLAARVEELAVRLAALRGSHSSVLVADCVERCATVLPGVVAEYNARTADVSALKTDGVKALEDQIALRLDPKVPS